MKFLYQSHFFKQRKIIFQDYLNGLDLVIKQEVVSKRRVFILNVPLRFSDNVIKKIFERFGPVESAYRIRYDSRPKKKAVITFYKFKDKKECLESEILFLENGDVIKIEEFIRRKDQSKAKKKSKKNKDSDKIIREYEKEGKLKPTKKIYYLAVRKLNHNKENLGYKKGYFSKLSRKYGKR